LEIIKTFNRKSDGKLNIVFFFINMNVRVSLRASRLNIIFFIKCFEVHQENIPRRIIIRNNAFMSLEFFILNT
jgi:hypothetical protein